jgi:hypothetical protein
MKIKIMSIVSVIIFAFITSCDDDDNFGGDTRDFDTVYVYAAFEADAYTADAAQWEDTSNPADGTCDIYYCIDDDIYITVTSTVKESLDCDCDASSIKKEKIRVRPAP